MATVRVVLRKKKNKAGRFPISIRITKDRKSSYLNTGQYIDIKFWDEKNRNVRKSHPNSKVLNNFIITKVAEANDKVLKSEMKTEYQTVSEIKNKIVVTKGLDFFAVAEMHLQNLKNRNKHHQYDTELGRLKKFKEFLCKDSLPFNRLNVTVLKKFETHLLHTKNLSPRTVVNYLILIRTIFNLAISESITDRGLYPFGKGKMTIRIPEAQKIGFTADEIQILENAQGITEAQQKAIHIWLVSFYFAGIRIGDVLQLKWSDFNDGRLLYRMNKNSKLVSLKIPEKAIEIFDFYKDNSSYNELVFPQLKGTNLNDTEEISKRTQSITRNLNRRLKIATKQLGIKKNISMHIARHSFGNISGDKIPIQMLQKLYRHSSVTTTIRYQANFIHKDADDALDSVVNF
ncbi:MULTISPECIES: site-specific integrase [Flavobacteriaceae]|jgi:integrase|uniref:Site-specific recombinase XerD n=1 Tax=Leeuwenhoekiella aequorea TaxID=283736 RepID=A0A4Q0P7Q1_9FLAO|nr:MULTISPECIES: site-specific integrase [Flavobacteriaceae]RXG22740.1 site-specific recombinase XerD [Leeuwenhoekiella aequorea]WSP35012.1 site-specific integrase [Croceibacter atlanticus]|tara:strand:- start:868 stop:2073 length:1206 start_codon:yes stop_codon:yes gene_type:complete